MLLIKRRIDGQEWPSSEASPETPTISSAIRSDVVRRLEAAEQTALQASGEIFGTKSQAKGPGLGELLAPWAGKRMNKFVDLLQTGSGVL